MQSRHGHSSGFQHFIFLEKSSRVVAFLILQGTELQIEQVAKGHFKLKRKLRLPKFKFKQEIEKFSADALSRDLYISINILWILW